MAFGQFTLVIDGHEQDGTTETKAKLYLKAQGSSGIVLSDTEFRFPTKYAKPGGAGISLPDFELDLDTDSTSGNSTTIGYEGFVTSDHAGRQSFQFAAPQAGTVLNLRSATSAEIIPVADQVVLRDDAEAAATAAAASAATAVAMLGPAPSGDATGATDATNLQAALTSAMGGTLLLPRAGTYQTNAPLYVPYSTKVELGPATTIKAVGTFPAATDLLQDAPPTIVAAGSNGVATTSATTLNVADTTGYPAAGQVRVAVTGGTAIMAYTGKTGTAFTGVTQAGGYSAGSFATTNKVAARSAHGSIMGGGTLDSNGLARHGLWLHYYGGYAVGVLVKNSTGDDIVLGDSAAVAASYQHRLFGNKDLQLVERDAAFSTLPVGGRCLYVTASATDGGFSGGRVVLSGQRTGVQVDGSNMGGEVHAWGTGMEYCVYDNGTDNHLDMVCDTPSIQGLKLGISQDRARHKGLVYNNAIYGTDNVMVAVRNDGSAKLNDLEFHVVGADASHRIAAEYTGNYGAGRFRFLPKNVTAGGAFRRNLHVADAATGAASITAMGDAANTQDLARFYLQSSGVVGALQSSVDPSGNFRTLVAGIGMRIKEGTNAKQGVATLVAGTVTVSNTSVVAASRILLTGQDNNVTGALRVSARTAGTSFTITSSNAGDTGVVAYEIFEQG